LHFGVEAAVQYDVTHQIPRHANQPPLLVYREAAKQA
jgi:hypothetical protein